jgi:hypothetical protein
MRARRLLAAGLLAAAPSIFLAETEPAGAEVGPAGSAVAAFSPELDAYAYKLRPELERLPVFGQLVLRHEEPGFTVYVTDPTDKDLGEVLARFNAFPVQTEMSEASSASLQERSISVVPGVERLRKAGVDVQSWGPTVDGHFSVSVYKLSAGGREPFQREQVQEELGHDVQVTEQAIPNSPGYTRATDVSPYWGGDFLSSNGSACSSGYGFHSASNVQYVVTAGHCGNVGSTWRMGSSGVGGSPTGTQTVVGNITAEGFNDSSRSYVDAGAIRLPVGSSAAKVIFTKAGYANVAAIGRPSVGNVICMDGAFEEDYICGPVRGEDYLGCHIYTGLGTACKTITSWGTEDGVHDYAGQGDSGGPVYAYGTSAPAPNNGSITAVGLFEGGQFPGGCYRYPATGRSCGMYVWHTDVQWVQTEFAITLNKL